MKKILILLAAITVSACTPPATAVIEKAPKEIPSSVPAAVEPPAIAPNDGLRLPADMLKLPDENQLRSVEPIKPKGDASIIASPPTD